MRRRELLRLGARRCHRDTERGRRRRLRARPRPRARSRRARRLRGPRGCLGRRQAGACGGRRDPDAFSGTSGPCRAPAAGGARDRRAGPAGAHHRRRRRPPSGPAARAPAGWPTCGRGRRPAPALRRRVDRDRPVLGGPVHVDRPGADPDDRADHGRRGPARERHRRPAASGEVGAASSPSGRWRANTRVRRDADRRGLDRGHDRPRPGGGPERVRGAGGGSGRRGGGGPSGDQQRGEPIPVRDRRPRAAGPDQPDRGRRASTSAPSTTHIRGPRRSLRRPTSPSPRGGRGWCGSSSG